MTERNGVQIDYCPDCRAIWLEKGSWTKFSKKLHLLRVVHAMTIAIVITMTNITATANEEQAG